MPARTGRARLAVVCRREQGMTDSGHDGNNAVDEERGDADPADGGRAEKRSPRSIRFLDPEWESIEAYAETRGWPNGSGRLRTTS